MKKYYASLLTFILFIGLTCTGQQKIVSGFIKAGNLRVYYERVGKGEAILLLHAGLQDHTMWSEQVRALSAKYEVITPDLPFHGKTTGTDTTLLAKDVLKILLDSLHLQKLCIAGLSMGAAVAEDFVIGYPERVTKAIFISAGVNGYEKIYPVDSLSMNWYIQFDKALKGGDTAIAALEFTKAWAEGIYRQGDSLKAPVSKYVFDKTLYNLRLHKIEGWPVLQNHPPAIESLASVKIPVLIINGDKDLPYITATSQYLKKNIPGARQIVMKDAAHMLNMEKPAELNKLMLDFLKKR